MDLDFLIFLFPVLEENAPYVAVGTAGEESEDGTVRWGLAQVRRPQLTVGDVDFRQGDVTDGSEAFAGVGIA